MMRFRLSHIDLSDVLPMDWRGVRRVCAVAALVVGLAGFGYFMTPATKAESAYMTGDLLLRKCSTSNDDPNFSCRGYIAGVVDYHRLVRSLGTAPGVDFCIPTGTSMDIVTEVVIQYLAANPQHEDFIAAPAVAMALYQAFPCK